MAAPQPASPPPSGLLPPPTPPRPSSGRSPSPSLAAANLSYRWLAPLTRLVTELDVSEQDPLAAIVEANVKAQVANVVRTDIITRAWARGSPVHVHGWLYLVEEGRLKDLQISQGPGPN